MKFSLDNGLTSEINSISKEDDENSEKILKDAVNFYINVRKILSEDADLGLAFFKSDSDEKIVVTDWILNKKPSNLIRLQPNGKSTKTKRIHKQ